MRKRLEKVGSGRGIMIDEPILEFIGAASVEEWELTTTDGHTLTLEPIRVRVVRRTGAAPAAKDDDAIGTVSYEDPKGTVRVLHVAQARGFTQDHFRRVHHAGPKASMQTHIAYCLGTKRFTSKTNIIVCQRLVAALVKHDEGMEWGEAIAAANRQFPFPPER